MVLAPWAAAFLAAALTCGAGVTALRNGMGLLPEMGFNTWYMTHSHLTYPNYTWEAGYCLSDDTVAIATWFKDNGFLELGYTWANFDDCIVWDRDATGTLVPDPQAFPFGPKNTSARLKSLGYKMGWYTDRGQYTCSCYAGGHQRPGSAGHEAQDAQWYAENGIEYLKDDSCWAPGGNEAIAEYGVQRDALNATGVPIYFSMCWGAGLTIASVGRQYGNGWRIDEDDGGGWLPILQNINTDAGLYNYSGCRDDAYGCGWNDPGLLMVGGAGLTDDEGRAHFNFWCMLASKLLISVDPRNFSATTIETLTNQEVIAIDQDALKIQAQRLVPALDGNRWRRDVALREQHRREQEMHVGLRREYWLKYRVVAPTYEHVMDLVPGTELHDVLSSGGRPEVWGRPLQGGRFALLFFNNGMNQTTAVSCDAACWAQTGFSPNTTVTVRDVWSHTDNGTAAGSLTVPGIRPNATVLVTLTPS